jgi:branched-chain amino acid transport system substrate-binding protein
MKFAKWLTMVSAAVLSVFGPVAAQAADKVVIGDIDDMAGLYADINGPRAVEVINMRSPISAAARSASRSRS